MDTEICGCFVKRIYLSGVNTLEPIPMNDGKSAEVRDELGLASSASCHPGPYSSSLKFTDAL